MDQSFTDEKNKRKVTSVERRCVDRLLLAMVSKDGKSFPKKVITLPLYQNIIHPAVAAIAEVFETLRRRQLNNIEVQHAFSMTITSMAVMATLHYTKLL